MIFNGVKKEYLTVGRAKDRPTLQNVERTISTVDGMDGGYLTLTKTGVGILNIPVLIKSDSNTDLQRLKEDMAAWLYTEKPSPLIFSDDQERTYYAVVDGQLNLDELIGNGTGIITFICPDPFKYGKEVIRTGASSLTVNNEGTVPTDPIIKVDIKKDVTYVAVSDGKEMNMIGNHVSYDETPFKREVLSFSDEMGTTLGWTRSDVSENATIGGTMIADGTSFFATDYGTGSHWHGPAMKKSIGPTIQDFQIDVRLRQQGLAGQLGDVIVTLLDAQNRVVASLKMIKNWKDRMDNHAILRAGSRDNGRDVMNYGGDFKWVWSNFDGLLRLSRVGNYWTAYVEAIRNQGSFYRTFRDVRGIATAPIAQVQVQICQYANFPASRTQRVDDIKIYKINSEANGIPYIAEANDVIEFDHVNDKIYKNGELINKEKAFIGKYFSLEEGVNGIVVEPSDAIHKTEVIYREKYR